MKKIKIKKKLLSMAIVLSMGITFFSPIRTYAATGLTVTDVSTTNSTAAQELANKLVGSGVTISNAKFTGITTAAGTFTGGLSSIGFDSGIILSNGSAKSVEGISSDDADTANGQAGDTSANGSPNLEELYSDTNDAAMLEFDVTSPNDKLSFEYAFASEEYNEYVNMEFNDVFELFVNGVNQALIPNTSTVVSINNVNAGNPVGTNAHNSEYYIDNTDGHLPFSMNGITTVLPVSATITPNVPNHIKIVIADVGDDAVDSNIFIKANSLNATSTEVTVDSVNSLNDITVSNGTDENSIGLPDTIDITLSDGTTTSSAVTWNNASPAYDGNTAGTYTFTGTLTLPDGVANSNNYTASINVIVQAANNETTPPAVIIDTTPAAVTVTHHHHHSSTASTSTTTTNNTDTKKNDDNNNIKKIGWTQDTNETKYYIKDDGSKAIGWKLIDNKWYFFNNKTGAMVRGWYKSEAGDWTYDQKDTLGQWFHLGPDGKMDTGWFKDTDGTWYYLCDGRDYGALGYMQTGWKYIDGKWYFFNSNGAMASNTVVDGYTLGNDGALAQ